GQPGVATGGGEVRRGGGKGRGLCACRGSDHAVVVRGRALTGLPFFFHAKAGREEAGMSYLDPSEYEQYGLDPAVPDAWVEMASTLVESHCRRPSLNVTPYTERVRVLPGARTVRLSYLPLATVA